MEVDLDQHETKRDDRMRSTQAVLVVNCWGDVFRYGALPHFQLCPKCSYSRAIRMDFNLQSAFFFFSFSTLAPLKGRLRQLLHAFTTPISPSEARPLHMQLRNAVFSWTRMTAEIRQARVKRETFFRRPFYTCRG